MNVTARLAAAWRSVDPRVVDTAVALLLFALMVGELAGRPPGPGELPTTPPAYGLAAAITLPLAVHRRYPVPVLLVVGAAITVYAFGSWTAFPGWAAFALVFVVGLHRGRRLGALAAGVMAVALAVALAVQPPGVVTAGTWLTSALVLVVAWLAGDNLWGRQRRWEALQDRAARLETEREERARQAVTAERLRIARELHDVVAHAMSVVAVQAGVANHVIDSRPDLAREAIGTVETSTRAALVEMRRLLGVLRQGDESAGELAPSPGLGQVPALVAQLADVGLTVRVRTDGDARDLPDGVDLSAYRIVQEGLTNALRHGGPVADVTVRHRPGVVEIEVSDDGRSGGPSTAGAGHGLLGMRERVAVYGGTLTAGPRPGGGFRLVATLPYGEPATPPALVRGRAA
jgi:signal transduction histidine kinase